MAYVDQIRDILLVENYEFEIYYNLNPLFDPNNFLLPERFATKEDQKKGYYCIYKIENDTFYLKDLFINFVRSNHEVPINLAIDQIERPEINGVKPWYSCLPCMGRYFNNYYSNVNLKLDIKLNYLCIGKDCIKECYHPIERYKTRLDLRINNDIVTWCLFFEESK